MLQRIQITENTVFDTPTLLALVADAHGKNTSLPELNALAARITSYYRAHGYPLSRAVVPSQTIELGVITIEVVEARYAQIELVNSSRVRDSLLKATLSPLKSKALINDVALENVLLLLSDIPGIGVKGVIKAGPDDGTSDLAMHTTPLPVFYGSVAADNYGNAYTGQGRLGGNFTLTNPLHSGDTLNASFLSSGQGLRHWRLAYEATLNGLGSRAGASSSSLNYTLGGAFESKASGSAKTQSVWARHPMVRSHYLDLHVQAQYDGMQTHDSLAGYTTQPDRDLRGITLSLSGHAHDSTFQNITSTWKLSWTSGQVQLRDNLEQPGDQGSASPSQFSKWNLNLAHLLRLSPQSAIYVSYAGQRAQSSLDPSQKLTVGGPYTVRAYAMGAISGDSADVLSAEWQQSLGQAWKGQWQAVAFVDTARITINPVGTAGPNTVSLSGAGIGLNWTGPAQLTARSVIAIPLGAGSELVNADKSVRAWLEVQKVF